MLVLDAGEAVFASPAPPDEGVRARGSLVLAGMGKVGTAAMAVGARDLAAGEAWLQKEAKAAGLPLLSANLRRADGSRPFEASRLVTVGGHPVGVIGLWVSSAPPPFGWAAADAAEAARAEVAKLRGKGARLVVALVHGNHQESSALAGVEGLDLVIPARDGAQGEPLQPKQEGPWILAAGSRGRSVLAVEIHPAGKGPLVDVGQVERAERDRSFVRARLEDARRRQETAADERMRNALGHTIASFERRLAELEAVPSEVPSSGRRFVATHLLLDAQVPDHPELGPVVTAFEKRHPAPPGAGAAHGE